MKIVVVGGTGFLGRYIVRDLIASGHDLAVMTRDAGSIREIPHLSGATEVIGDVTDPDSLRGSLDGADAVVGAVAFPNYPVEQPRKGLTFDRYERVGTENLLAEAERAGVRRYFYMSGAGADPYSETSWYRAKGLAESAIKKSGISYVILRPSWAYGPEDKALNKFAAIARFSPIVPQIVRLKAPTRRPTFIRFEKQIVQPVYVEDVSLAVQRAFERDDAWDRTFEIGGPENLTMHDVIKTMLEVMGKRRWIVPIPAPLAKLGTVPLLLLPTPPMSPGGIEFAVQDAIVDTTEMTKVLEVEPRPLRAGLSLYLRKR